MDIGDETKFLLADLDRLSTARLLRRDDLGLLLELGWSSGRRAVLDDLAFSARFLARARGMMERVGPGAVGYDRLADEFSRHVEKAAALLDALIEGAPAEEAENFRSRYAALTPEGLGNLLALSSDLGWYKNWLIDQGRKRNPPRLEKGP